MYAIRSYYADLVTVAQALHWFDIQAFFSEVKRVLKNGGVLAAWTYGLLEVNPANNSAAINEEINTLYGPVLADLIELLSLERIEA